MHEKHSSIITYYTRLDTMYVLCSLRHDVSGFFFVSAPFHVRLDQQSCLVEDQSPAITHWERPINNKADLFNFVLFEYNEESKYFDWLNRRPSSWRKSLTRQWMCLFVFFYHVCAHYIGNSWKQNTKNTDRVVLFLVGQSSMWLSNLWYTDIRIRVFLAFSGSKLVQLLNFGMRLSDCLCCVGCARWEWLRHLSCNAKIPHFPFNFRCRAERWLICMHVYGVNVRRCARL